MFYSLPFSIIMLCWWANGLSWQDAADVHVRVGCLEHALSFLESQVRQQPGGAAVKLRPTLTLLSNSTAKSSRPICKFPAGSSGKHLAGDSVKKFGARRLESTNQWLPHQCTDTRGASAHMISRGLNKKF